MRIVGALLCDHCRVWLRERIGDAARLISARVRTSSSQDFSNRDGSGVARTRSGMARNGLAATRRRLGLARLLVLPLSAMRGGSDALINALACSHRAHALSRTNREHYAGALPVTPVSQFSGWQVPGERVRWRHPPAGRRPLAFRLPPPPLRRGCEGRPGVWGEFNGYLGIPAPGTFADIAPAHFLKTSSPRF